MWEYPPATEQFRFLEGVWWDEAELIELVLWFPVAFWAEVLGAGADAAVQVGVASWILVCHLILTPMLLVTNSMVF
jgi:hypothetical protein